jgi:lysyl endopeptidase
MKTAWILLAAILAASVPAAADPLSIHGEPAVATKAAPAAKLRLGRLVTPVTTLGAVTDAEMAGIVQANRRNNKRMTIGIERVIGATRLPTAADLEWKPVEGGSAAQVAVSSPQAGALRLGVDLAGVPANVEMVAFGSDNPSRLEGPVRVADILDRTQTWWSPITDGSTQTIEFFVPSGIDAASLPIRITGVAHLFTTLASGLKKRTSEIGESGSCEIDVKCSSLYPTLAFQNMRNAVAQMVLQDGHSVILCTGQLLNDTDTSSQIPWFYSANHCFDNEDPPYKTADQMQTVANTVQTLWFFEAVTCSNPSDQTVPSYAQVNGGSTYLYSDQPSDALMVKLNSAVPPGVFYAGWDATALPVGTAVVVAHHPEGDLKKVSQGSLVADSTFPGTTATNLFNEVKYSSGTTEPGSSGAGLFSFNGTEYLVRGALFGGGAACNALSASDWYSQFDKAYPHLAPYLNAVAVPAFDYTDLWWNSNESGWGLNLVQHAGHQVFGVWFTYASGGKPTWYTLPGGTWTSSTTFTGAVYATTGPSAASATFNASSVTVRQAGSATLTFSDANNGTFAYTVDGVTESKAITRQPY